MVKVVEKMMKGDVLTDPCWYVSVGEDSVDFRVFFDGEWECFKTECLIQGLSIKQIEDYKNKLKHVKLIP